MRSACRRLIPPLLSLALFVSPAWSADDPRAGLKLLAPRALGAERGILGSAQAVEAGVATLAIALDGREIAVGPAPRLDAAVPLGWPPRPQILEAEARDPQGCPVELELAFLHYPARSFPVALRVTGVGCDEEGPWARVFARAPLGETLAETRLWAGDRLVGRSRQSPALFRLTGRDLAEPFLRAEVALAGGGVAEATQLFDRGRFDDAIDVRRGEARRLLPERDPRPAELTTERVIARWRDALQRIVSVEAGAALPLALAVAVDASPSTLDFRDRVLELAAETARTLAPNGDRAGEAPVLVLFSESALVTVADAAPERTAALADSLPFGTTALFDALAVALHENLAPGRRAATIAVTDGCDTGSATAAEEVAELARALGVPVYALVFDEKPCFEVVRSETKEEHRRTEDARYQAHDFELRRGSPDRSPGSIVRSPGWGRTRHALQELCRASGGELYRVAGKDDLSKVWKRILAGLERQAVIVYEPSGPEVDPAEIEIEIAPPKRRGLFRR